MAATGLNGAGRPAFGPPPGTLYDALGNVVPPTNDIAWQPPRDPLKDGNAKARASVIHREVPLVVSLTGWTVPQVRGALEDLVLGQFDAPAQLIDTIIADSRVQSAMASRTGGLLGRPITHELPDGKSDDKQAKRCRDAWREVWPTLGNEAALGEFQRWSSMLSMSPAQLLWDTSEDLWCPYLSPWHPRYTYWHWSLRKLIAITLDGQVPITAGDGHWVLHAPMGEYRGWMRGAVRAIAPWWLARSYALRDWARYSERHGMPILLARTPFGADTEAVNTYRVQLSQLGQESVIQLPTSEDPGIGSYDLEALEFSDQAWLAFSGLITQCNAEITLALLGQNLTTEVKEGSFAAARVHADVRQAILEADARALEHTIYTQIARPFAAVNFGDPNLAPRTCWDVAPYEDNKLAAETFAAFAMAVQTLRTAGKKVGNVVALARSFGLKLKDGDISDAPPETKITATTDEAKDAKPITPPTPSTPATPKAPDAKGSTRSSGRARARGTTRARKKVAA